MGVIGVVVVEEYSAIFGNSLSLIIVIMYKRKATYKANENFVKQLQKRAGDDLDSDGETQDSEPMFNDLEIHPIQPDEDVSPFTKDIAPPLPGSDGHPFVMVALGKRKSGKTTILNNLILKESMMRNRFSQIIIISPTIIYDQTSRFLVEEAGKYNCFDTYTDGIIDRLIEFQASKEKKERKHILLIADDLIGTMKRECKAFSLSSRSRHYLISIIYLTQNLRTLSPVVRGNATHWALFRNPNMKEMEKVCEEFAFLGSKNNVYRLYEHITKVPYNFMYVDDDYNVWENFTKKIWSKFNESGGYNAEWGGEGTIEDMGDDIPLDNTEEIVKK